MIPCPHPSELRFQLIWYDDPTAAEQAIGLNNVLSDIGNNNPDYWTRFDRQAWRNSLRGQIAMNGAEMAHKDPDWLRPGTERGRHRFLVLR